MGVPSLNDLAVDGTLNTTNQPTKKKYPPPPPPKKKYCIFQIVNNHSVYCIFNHSTHVADCHLICLDSGQCCCAKYTATMGPVPPCKVWFEAARLEKTCTHWCGAKRSHGKDTFKNINIDFPAVQQNCVKAHAHRRRRSALSVRYLA